MPIVCEGSMSSDGLLAVAVVLAVVFPFTFMNSSLLIIGDAL